MKPDHRGMDPEDELLFQDLDEDSVQSKSVVNGSWLRYMEYGDVSVQSKTSSSSIVPEEKGDFEASRIERIERSFVHSTPIHKDRSKEVVAECVWEVLPDSLLSCFDYGLVVRWRCFLSCSLHSTLKAVVLTKLKMPATRPCDFTVGFSFNFINHLFIQFYKSFIHSSPPKSLHFKSPV